MIAIPYGRATVAASAAVWGLSDGPLYSFLSKSLLILVGPCFPFWVARPAGPIIRTAKMK
jgi:hypothetical protein